jgi:hypothetical protein
LIVLGRSGTFTVERAMQAARGFHHASGELQAAQHRFIRRRLSQLPTKVTADQFAGWSTGALVLEALAVELVLKARLKRAGISFAGLPDKHDHSALYALMRDVEKQEADQRYQSSRHPMMRATLAEALDFSAEVFMKWRYIHEHGPLQANMGEMQRAFAALADGI